MLYNAWFDFFIILIELSQAQKTFAKDLKDLQFQCIDKQTDDETTIGESVTEAFFPEKFFSKISSVLSEDSSHNF